MKKLLFPILVFVAAACIALYNIGGFPKMAGDEGIYVSQAWWLVHLGKLGPYTYWYDHFPLGWAQIGIWQWLVGPARFGGLSVLSARVFMGGILAGTTTLLFLLTRKLTKTVSLALLSSFIFATSALTLTFGRMVLLDNLAVFWFLLSLLLLFTHPTRLKFLALSAGTMAIAILSKESLLFFLPPYLFTVYALNRTNSHRAYAHLVSGMTLLFLLSFFPLLAILKGELVPAVGHVSFFGTLLFQAARGTGLPFWVKGSDFRQMLSVWLSINPVLLVLGGAATIATLALRTSFPQKMIAIFTVFFALFLVRGGQIYDFYIIPILPLLALNTTTVLETLATYTKIKPLPLMFLASLAVYVAATALYPFTAKATASQVEAIESLKSLPAGSEIVANNYAYLDIYLQGKNNIDWYEKVESDGSVQSTIPPITNMLVDEQFQNELDGNLLPYLKNQIAEETVKTSFGTPLSPGENDKPYAKEFLTLYEKPVVAKTPQYVVTLHTPLTAATLSALKASTPYGVLVTRENFANSSDLQNLLTVLKTNLDEQTLIVVSQDDTGLNTIPWVTTSARTFYKSAGEAQAATTQKTQALATLGATGAIVTSGDDTDGYLTSIVDAAKPYVTPLIRFTGTIPGGATTMLVNTENDRTKLENAGYQGPIVLVEP